VNPTSVKRPEPTWDWRKLGKKVEIRVHTTSVGRLEPVKNV